MWTFIYMYVYKYNTHMYTHIHTQLCMFLKYLQQAVDSDHPWEEKWSQLVNKEYSWFIYIIWILLCITSVINFL